MESPVGVLRSIAHRLGCPYDGIEAWLDEFYGAKDPMAAPTSVGQRLDHIRWRIGVAEGASVIDRAAELATEWRRLGEKCR